MSYTIVPKPIANWLGSSYNFILCEDGTFLLQEDDYKLVLEWYYSGISKPTTSYVKGTKPVTSYGKDSKPVVVWVK